MNGVFDEHAWREMEIGIRDRARTGGEHGTLLEGIQDRRSLLAELDRLRALVDPLQKKQDENQRLILSMHSRSSRTDERLAVAISTLKFLESGGGPVREVVRHALSELGDF